MCVCVLRDTEEVQDCLIELGSEKAFVEGMISNRNLETVRQYWMWGAGKVFQAEVQHKQRLRGKKQPGIYWGEASWKGGLQVLCWSVEMRHAVRQKHHHGSLHFIIYRMGATSPQLIGLL